MTDKGGETILHREHGSVNLGKGYDSHLHLLGARTGREQMEAASEPT